MDELLLAEETAENSTQEVTEVAEETAENSTTEQDANDRSYYANEDRRRKLAVARQERDELFEKNEQLNQTNARYASALTDLVEQLGIDGQTLEERAVKAKFLMEQHKTQQMMQKAQQMGVPVEVLQEQQQAAKQAEQYRQQAEQYRYELDATKWGDKIADVLTYCKSQNPNFTAGITPEQSKKMGIAIKNGFTAQEIYSMFGTAKTPAPGLNHIKSIRNASSTNVDVPQSVIDEYAMYGYGKDVAIKDYQKQKR